MGRSGNGELACRRSDFPVNCIASTLHNMTPLRPGRLGHCWPVTSGDDHVEQLLLGIEDAGPSAQRAEWLHLDGFATALKRQGYTDDTAGRYVGAAGALW